MPQYDADMDMNWEWMPLAAALAVALWMQPWRMLRQGSELLTPLLATLVIFPWLWALPRLHTMPLQLQLTGACLILLMLGWPLAVPVLCLIAAISGLIAPATPEALIAAAFWLGVLPATLAVLLGALLRWVFGPHMFVYILGRGFLGTVLCVFASSQLAGELGHHLPFVEHSLDRIAHWLIAWGDGFMTGMFCAIFVAFRPQWLATWSDRLYLKTPT